MFFTNLFIHSNEKFPNNIPCRPMVGDMVQSLWEKDNKILTLQVKQVTFCNDGTLEVELDISKALKSFIPSWIKWYKEFRNI
jgi:hypothetical protein